MTCLICTLEFEPKIKKQKYCCRKCATKAVHLRNIKHIPGERLCEYCEKPYTPGIGRSNRGTGGKRFCSLMCRIAGQRGINAPNWCGGRHTNQDGYVELWIDGKVVKEHRHVMSQRLKRPLTKDETVHHINGVKNDNRDANLELWTSRHPKGQRVADLIAWANEFLPLYGLRVVKL